MKANRDLTRKGTALYNFVLYLDLRSETSTKGRGI